PWTASECTGFIAAAEGERPVLTAERSDWWCEEDHRLAAAAPEMRATIAAQTWQWGVLHRQVVICLDFYGTEDEEPGHQRWTTSRSHAEKWKAYMEGVLPREAYHLVRRPVGPVEVVEK
ncbi:hypothetical protein, partial [Corynebacterium sp. AOP12-C2-36]|uniref:hypothetical protein n=1 Tax=Corynebacterium sp. AOP12-C2-36 TaxID=3457723 RepID=UPI00403394D8